MKNTRRELLSVLIPTCNRSDYLHQCLASILPQALELGIDVYVSDNASIDTTQQVLSEFTLQYPNLTVHTHEQNVGHDLNHLHLLSRCRSKYAWLLGDDDVPLDNSLSQISSFLRDNTQTELLLLNAYLTDHNLKVMGTQFINGVPGKVNDCLSLIHSYHDKLTFGMLIVSLDHMQLTRTDKYIGTAHLYGGLIYDYLASTYKQHAHNEIYIYRKPLVLLRQGERPWSASLCDINLRGVPIFLKSLDIIYQPYIASCIQKATSSRHLLPTIFNARCTGLLTPAYCSIILDSYSTPFRAILTLASVSPIPIVALVRDSYLYLSRLYHLARQFIFRATR